LFLWCREWENRTLEILAMPTQSIGVLADKRFIIASVLILSLAKGAFKTYHGPEYSLL
jgi:hypothetical protein